MTVKDLREHKKSLYSSMCRDLTEFEKNFLILSTGLLAFSITFIKDIVKLEISTGLLVLLGGWATIIAAIALMMFSFLKSAWDSDNLWKTADDFMVNKSFYLDATTLSDDQWTAIKQEMDEIWNKSKASLKRMRIAAVVLFLVGVICMVTFVSINLKREIDSSKNSKTRNNTNSILPIIDTLKKAKHVDSTQGSGS